MDIGEPSTSQKNAKQDEGGMEPKKRRKGQRHDDEYKRNVIKKARVRGVEYVNYKKKMVEEKCIGPKCKCPMKCYKIREEQRNGIFTKFYDMSTKNEQYTSCFSNKRFN